MRLNPAFAFSSRTQEAYGRRDGQYVRTSCSKILEAPHAHIQTALQGRKSKLQGQSLNEVQHSAHVGMAAYCNFLRYSTGTRWSSFAYSTGPLAQVLQCTVLKVQKLNRNLPTTHARDIVRSKNFTSAREISCSSCTD